MVPSEEILDLLSTLIADLGEIREQTSDRIDRAAINNQIMALTALWRKLDDVRASEMNDQLSASKIALEGITQELNSEKKKLENIAKVIYRSAQAIAIAEEVVKLVG